MSALTKLFVVLLVLLSIILTAGVVTFVNKLAPIQRDLETARAKTASAEAITAARTSALDALTLQLGSVRQAAAADATAHQAQIQTYRSTIEDRDTQLATVNNNLAVLTSANASQSAALASSEDSKTKLQDQVVALRKDSDDRQRTSADLGTRVSTLTSERDVLERERRNLTEQLTELQNTAQRQAKALTDAGVPVAQIERAGTGAGAPAINGVIRSRRTIAGKEYATISIGAQDQVIKGMEFKILDKDTGNFLGIMTVNEVDSNEAIGAIVAEPSMLAQIRAGNVVKTQI